MAAKEFVVVACKLPNGLECEVADITYEDIQGSKVATKQNVERFWLRGSAQARVLDNNERIGEHPDVIGGYGISQVPKDLWDKWWTMNCDHNGYTFPPIKAGLIFAAPRAEATRKMAAERANDIKSGLEPIRPTVVNDSGRVTSGDVDPRTVFGNRMVTQEPEAAQRRKDSPS